MYYSFLHGITSKGIGEKRSEKARVQLPNRSRNDERKRAERSGN